MKKLSFFHTPFLFIETIECSRSVHSIVLRMARVNGNMSSAALQLILKKTLPL